MQHNKAFTLLEVMVAMTILALSLSAIMHLFSTGLKATEQTEDYTYAAILARSKMEEVLLQRQLDTGGDSGTFDEFGGKYSYTVEVEEMELEHLKKETLDFDATHTQAGEMEDEFYKTFSVTVTISWAEGRKRLPVSSIRTDYINPEAD